MSREIKFRFFFDGMMHPVSGLHFGMDGSPALIKHREVDVWIESHDCSLMQFTGLYDRNGVEIYENDVLSDSAGNIVTVEIIGSCVCGCYTLVEKRYNAPLLFPEHFERLGNIHEHPTLLTSTHEGEE